MSDDYKEIDGVVYVQQGLEKHLHGLVVYELKQQLKERDELLDECEDALRSGKPSVFADSPREVRIPYLEILTKLQNRNK